MIWLILLLGLLLRIISLNQSLWLDETINALASKNFSLLGMITEYAKADFHPPLFFIISWIWNIFFGISEVSIRIPSVIFGILTIYLVYLIGQKLHSKTLGLVTALLLAVNPLHVYYSQEGRMYALATLAVSINIFLFIKFLKDEKLNPIFLIISNLFIQLSDYVAYLIFPAQFIFLLVVKKERKHLNKFMATLLGATLLGIWWIPTFLNQLNVGSVVSSRLPSWKLIVGGFDIRGIPLTFIKFIIGRISYPDKFIYALILIPISFLFLFLIWRGVKSIKNLERNLLISWLFIPIILATLISFIVPIYSYFRLLFVLPSFIILIALGIMSLKNKLKYFFLIAVFTIELFSTCVYLFNPIFQREDWRGAVNFLKSKNGSLVLFESSGTLPPFDYYAKGKLNAKGALKDFPVKDDNGVIDLISYENFNDVYLVDYLVEVTDPKRLVSKKLNESGYKNIDTKDFHGVGFVYHYAK